MTNEATGVKLKNVLTPKFLGCYVTLNKPRAMEKDKTPEYSISMLFAKKSQNWRADLGPDMAAAIDAAAISKFGPNGGRALGGALRSPVRDGDQKVKTDTGEADPTYKGHWFINAKSVQRVAIVATDKTPVDPNEVYSGCFFYAQVRFFPYAKSGNKGVGCGLQNVMLVRKGPRIDGREDADTAFRDFKPEVEEGSDDISDMV